VEQHRRAIYGHRFFAWIAALAAVALYNGWRSRL
jgi:hypothetical protein